MAALSKIVRGRKALLSVAIQGLNLIKPLAPSLEACVAIQGTDN